MPAAALRDIRGPMSLEAHINPALWLVILVILAAAAFIYIYLLRRKKAALTAPLIPAHELAYRQLQALRQMDFIRQGKVKQYYSEISDIIRHYLENRFSLRAPEMTTEEFLFYVRDYGSLAKEHKALLKDFLLACDLVKFAKYTPSDQDMEAIFASAKKLVDETREVGAGLKPAPTNNA